MKIINSQLIIGYFIPWKMASLKLIINQKLTSFD